MANLRQALEHVGDQEWLEKNTPLRPSLQVTQAATSPSRTATPTTGVRELDERLAAIRQDWDSRPKNGLQALLWSAVNRVAPDKNVNHAALLALTYFQDPRPKQSDLIKLLAVGQSTFYRQLNAAVEALERTLLTQLQPSLRLETPPAKPLIGRDDVLRDCLAALREDGVVSIVGGSGLGKTSLGAAVAAEWDKQADGQVSAGVGDVWSHLRASARPHIRTSAVFWFTFRPGLTDNVQHLIFTLALFLHQHGVSHLWQHLMASPTDVSMAKALAVIRTSFEELNSKPILCFDEVDLLLPGELDDTAEYAQLRSVLEELIEVPRNGVPMLLIGQRLLVEPERSHVFTLRHFDTTIVRDLFSYAGLPHDDDACTTALRYTRGNPLLLQLLITLHRMGEPVLANVSYIASAATLDWFLTRVRRHLTAKEQDLLDAACVFDAPMPPHIWRGQARALDKLVQLNLIERTTDQIGMPMALREGLYRRLPNDLRDALHISAAQTCVDLGAFTLAARHFVLGKQPEMAIWTWHTHADNEIQHGQSQTALDIFEPLRFVPLDAPEDQQALALILARLHGLHGKADEGLSALESTTWQPNRPASARAAALRGRLLAQRGDIAAALVAYRAALDKPVFGGLAHPITLRTELALQLLERARDITSARHEARLAQADVEMVLGYIEELSGDMAAARRHLLTARDLMQNTNDPVRLAKASEALGLLEARRLNTDAAVHHLEEAGRHYDAYGNIVCSIGMTNTNIAFAYLLAQQFEQAISPAQRAVDFFLKLNQPYFLSNSEACLAEAFANTDRLAEAETLAWRALAHEETSTRPYALYVLAHICRQQARLGEAEQLAKDAIATATANDDAWNLGYAWRVLGAVYRDLRKIDDAYTAYASAHAVFTKLGLTREAEEIQACLCGLVPTAND